MDFGFVKLAIATPVVRVADCGFNGLQIENLIKEAAERQVQVVCFPELCITAYTCGDLFFQKALLDEAENTLSRLLEDTKKYHLLSVVGMPVTDGVHIFNAAVAFQSGKVLAIVPKTFLPNYSEFYEKRWFVPASLALGNTFQLCGQTVPFGADILLKSGVICVSIEICEDLWMPHSPTIHHAQHGANIMLNLSASNDVVGKNTLRRELVLQQSLRCKAAYAYTSAGFGESTTDVVLSGSGYIAESGILLAEHQRFTLDNQLTISDIDIERLSIERQRNTSFTTPLATDTVKDDSFRRIAFNLVPNKKSAITRVFNPHPFINKATLDTDCEEILSIQSAGLAKRLLHLGIDKVLLGVSGGLDSTLALLVCVKTFDLLKIPRQQITGVSMPGFGTTNRTHNNAETLCKALGVAYREIDIKPACLQHFKDIGHDAAVFDICYENTQARERTQILMDIANKENSIVVGTGDLSELALGWTTYNGDHISMYGVNASVPKTLIPPVIRWVAMQQSPEAQAVLHDILSTPVSPELLPASSKDEIVQKTEDLVGPYELHDFFLYYTLRFGFRPAKIYFLAQRAFAGKYTDMELKKWLHIFFRHFFRQQFKRSCLPDGPKVVDISLSPRGCWRMPSDAVAHLWIEEVEGL
ncbi:MAG: NAD(+) synthase [Prevotellaceae bacterium]|jgi:NAD+ synthase (glutamine-hydrolysing)|nr:NAD(+) synthase [Prevotellaceae bacterium]